MNVANESVGLVIGKQGATIKQLEQQSGARIQIAKECPAGSNMRPITVSGPPASVEQAKSLILQKVSGVMPFFFHPSLSVLSLVAAAIGVRAATS